MKKIKAIALSVLFAVSATLCSFNINAETLPYKKLDNKKVHKLFEKNLLEYYKVDKKLYDTPLKEKKFLESSDYTSLKQRFEDDYAAILSNKYILSTKIKSQYNMKTNTFTFELPSPFNKELVLETTDPHFKGKTFVTPHMDEDTAYKIEMGDSSLEVIVQLTGEFGRKNNKALCCIPLKVLVRNKAGQILYEYIPVENDNQRNNY